MAEGGRLPTRRACFGCCTNCQPKETRVVITPPKKRGACHASHDLPAPRAFAPMRPWKATSGIVWGGEGGGGGGQTGEARGRGGVGEEACGGRGLAAPACKSGSAPSFWGVAWCLLCWLRQ